MAKPHALGVMTGTLYLGTVQGFYLSQDGGKTFRCTLEGRVAGVDVSRSAPRLVWLCGAMGVQRSDDQGRTWRALPGNEALRREDDLLRDVRVSPADSRALILWREGANYNTPHFFSRDGGATWTQSQFDNTHAFTPYNSRHGIFAWHPTNAQVLWSSGGDWPTISTDGGATLRWSGSGVHNILVGGGFNFNARVPQTVFLASQDYNGASTGDGGQTWTYQNPSGEGWGGFTYGGLALSEQVMWCGVASGWGGPRELTLTRDGGQTWKKSGLKWTGNAGESDFGVDVSFADPNNAQVAFAARFRTVDGGETWTPVTDCNGVLSADANGLWGTKFDAAAKKSALVRSRNSGATWEIVDRFDGQIRDIAAHDGQLFLVRDGALYRWKDGQASQLELPPDQKGAPRVSSVAIDPQNPDVIYYTSNRDVFASNASFGRSLDGGKTWTNLTSNTPLAQAQRDQAQRDQAQRDGGREAIWVRVHPQTREAWVATSCYGIWKIAAP